MISKNHIIFSSLVCGVLGTALFTSVLTNKSEPIVLENPVEVVGLANVTHDIKNIKLSALESNRKTLSLIENRNEQLASNILNEIKSEAVSISRKDVPVVASSFVKTEPGHMENINPETLQSELQTVSSNVVDTGEYEYIGEFKLTSFCGCRRCNGKWAGSNGKYGLPLVQGRTIAVDENVIPLGTWLEIYIEGQGWQRFRAEDTGNGVRGKHIDVYVGENHANCYNKQYNTNGSHTAQVRLVK